MIRPCTLGGCASQPEVGRTEPHASFLTGWRRAVGAGLHVPHAVAPGRARFVPTGLARGRRPSLPGSGLDPRGLVMRAVCSNLLVGVGEHGKAPSEFSGVPAGVTFSTPDDPDLSDLLEQAWGLARLLRFGLRMGVEPTGLGDHAGWVDPAVERVIAVLEQGRAALPAGRTLTVKLQDAEAVIAELSRAGQIDHTNKKEWEAGLRSASAYTRRVGVDYQIVLLSNGVNFWTTLVQEFNFGAGLPAYNARYLRRMAAIYLAAHTLLHELVHVVSEQVFGDYLREKMDATIAGALYGQVWATTFPNDGAPGSVPGADSLRFPIDTGGLWRGKAEAASAAQLSDAMTRVTEVTAYKLSNYWLFAAMGMGGRIETDEAPYDAVGYFANWETDLETYYQQRVWMALAMHPIGALLGCEVVLNPYEYLQEYPILRGHVNDLTSNAGAYVKRVGGQGRAAAEWAAFFGYYDYWWTGVIDSYTLRQLFSASPP